MSVYAYAYVLSTQAVRCNCKKDLRCPFSLRHPGTANIPVAQYSMRHTRIAVTMNTRYSHKYTYVRISICFVLFGIPRLFSDSRLRGSSLALCYGLPSPSKSLTKTRSPPNYGRDLAKSYRSLYIYRMPRSFFGLCDCMDGAIFGVSHMAPFKYPLKQYISRFRLGLHVNTETWWTSFRWRCVNCSPKWRPLQDPWI